MLDWAFTGKGEAMNAKKLLFVTAIVMLLAGLVAAPSFGKVTVDDREHKVIKPRPELPGEQPRERPGHHTRKCDEGLGNEEGPAAEHAGDDCDNTDNNKNEDERED